MLSVCLVLLGACTDDRGAGDTTRGDTTPAGSSAAPGAPPTAAETTTTAGVATTAETTTTSVPAPGRAPEPIAVGAQELTDHQQQLLGTVERFFRATGVWTLGSGPPDLQEVAAVIELFEPYGRVIWFNGVVHRVADDDFGQFILSGGLPYVDPSKVTTVQGPTGSVVTGSQFIVLEDQVVWMGHPDILQPSVMVFSFDRDGTRISTLYVSRGDPTLMDDIGIAWEPPERDECTITPTTDEVATLGVDEILERFGAEPCLHYWVVVTQLQEPQYGACRDFSGYYSERPERVTSGPIVNVLVNLGFSGDRATCVKMADLDVGDLVEVWGTLPPRDGTYDLEVVEPLDPEL